MEINKICPNILPFEKIQNKTDLPCVCVVSFTICSLLEQVLDFELYCQ